MSRSHKEMCSIATLFWNEEIFLGCFQSSVDLSGPTILPPPGLSPKHTIYTFVIYSQFCAIFVVCKEWKQTKKAEFGPFKKMFFYLTTFFTPLSTSQWVFIEERCRLLTSKSPFRLNHQQGRFTSGRVKGRFEGRGCDTVDSAVASDTRGPGFESSHWQLFEHIYG